MQHGVERRLLAILSADMVGYSRLMEIDEAGTLARLKAHRLELIDPVIARHRGRIVKTTGDGMLVEFASTVDAVGCAVEVQSRMAKRNSDVASERRILFRVGINVGDVIVEDGDVFGDGVNVAARLQAAAQPGGICVSHQVHDQVEGRLELTFDDMGDLQVKNIQRPIRAFQIRIDGVEPAAAAGLPKPEAGTDHQPSIAVLPFANMSGDPEQEFFADGLTEDIITELSRFRELLVISRNSTFVMKGRAVNVQEVAQQFGVNYVVEGSVRKAGNRVRITVQLIDARTDHHIWAERYDRDLADIFAIQDEVTSAIVSTLPGRLEAAARDRATRKTPDSLAAYELVLTAKVLHHRANREANAEALRLIDRAIAIEPLYAHAHAWKACISGQAWIYGWCQDRDLAWDIMSGSLQTALALDENDSDVHRILAAVHLTKDEHEAARRHQDRALALNPNNDLIVVQQGEIHTWLGEPEVGVEWIKKAMRLNPHHPERFWNHLGRAYFVARRYGEAIEAFRRITRPDQFHRAFLAASSAMAGDSAAAKSHAQAVLSTDPAFTVGTYLSTLHYLRREDLEHHREALLKAGLPA